MDAWRGVSVRWWVTSLTTATSMPRRLRRRTNAPTCEDDADIVFDDLPLPPGEPATLVQPSPVNRRKRDDDAILRSLHGDFWDLSDGEEGDDESASSSSSDSLADFVVDDDDGDDDDDNAAGRAVKPTHALDDEDKMALLVEDVIARHCGTQPARLDPHMMRFAQRPRALGESKISGLWKDRALLSAVQQCMYVKTSLVGLATSCCPQHDCEQGGRCHLCHYYFDGGAEGRSPHYLLLRGAVKGLTPSADAREWCLGLNMARTDASEAEHWCEMGNTCIKLARNTHAALHWYEHMCMRAVCAFEEQDDLALPLDRRITRFLESGDFVDRELAIYCRILAGVDDARHVLDESVQPWTYRGRTKCTA